MREKVWGLQGAGRSFIKKMEGVNDSGVLCKGT